MMQVLVFDHSTILRKVISALLTQKGYNVEEVLTRDACYSAVRLTMPDFIFIDGIIPASEISDLITAIRELPEGKKPKIIITPMEQDLGKITRAMRAGCDEYLLRPFEKHQLEEKMKIAA